MWPLPTRADVAAQPLNTSVAQQPSIPRAVTTENARRGSPGEMADKASVQQLPDATLLCFATGEPTIQVYRRCVIPLHFTTR